MKRSLSQAVLLALALTFTAATASAQTAAPAKPRGMQDILDASRPADWRAL
ncbi:MAG: hypothetical protein JF591_19570, partial [Lysobacter sp.]|nr:hypothetical protein [Lysobacter sp.]